MGYMRRTVGGASACCFPLVRARDILRDEAIDDSQIEDYLAKGEMTECKIDDTDITGRIT